MHLFPKNLIGALLSGGVLLFLASAANATLIGSTVSGCLNIIDAGGCTPTFTQGSWSNASATVADPGIEFTGDFFVLDATADFDAGTLTFSLTNNLVGSGVNAVDRQIAFQFSGAPDIVGFSQSGGALTATDISFTTTELFFTLTSDNSLFDFDEEEFNGFTKTATFQITTASVPEPGALALLGLSLLGIAFVRSKQRV